MSSVQSRFTRLLDRGFYPAELPPVFKTTNYSTAARNGLLGVTEAKKRKYASHVVNFDGSTFQGNLRTFGIINPVSYCFLGQKISEGWPKINSVYKLSKFSDARPSFPAMNADGRAITSSPLSAKRRHLQHLAGSFPLLLYLDINRFYASLYTHTLPWSALGKEEAKRRFFNKTLSGHWSDTLDLFVRNCNSRQTVGIPIGPDTSRILSELLLARIDHEVWRQIKTLKAADFTHSIDDYKFGVFSQFEAEIVQSAFIKIIQKYELRLNDFKTDLKQGLTYAPKNWQREFDNVRQLHGLAAVEVFFDCLYRLTQQQTGSNVVGYALKRFARQLASNAERQKIAEYLQRLLFAAPHHARWVFPILLGLYRQLGVSPQQKRAIVWGIGISARRGDVVTLLWFLYAALFLNFHIGKDASDSCFSLDNPLVDLMLVHGKELGCATLNPSQLKRRYRDAVLSDPAWVLCYEVERRNWVPSAGIAKIGSNADSENYFAALAAEDAWFYQADPSVFSLSSFSGWPLSDEAFQLEIAELDWGDVSFANHQFLLSGVDVYEF